MKLALHWQIMIGMILGVLFGYIFKSLGLSDFFSDWISPIGTIFINLLKLIAIPLIIASLIKGISDLRDISQFSRIGLRTILLYVTTTVIAISIGLLVVNVIQPGNTISAETVEQLTGSYGGDAQLKIGAAAAEKGKGPLQFLIDMVPDNVFGALGNNAAMLQVIFFTILL